MYITCDYCGTKFSDTETTCPSCGAPNAAMKRTADATPKTIQELKQWYLDRRLPPEQVTRFFIGKNIREARAIGIYEENGLYTVYKNKDDGSRAIRYQGKDEAYAVNEVYLKLKSEILNQKARQGTTRSAPSGAASRAYPATRAPEETGTGKVGGGVAAWVITVILWLAAITECAVPVIILTALPIIAIPCLKLFMQDEVRRNRIIRIIKKALVWYILAVVIIAAVFCSTGSSKPHYYSYDNSVYCSYNDNYYVYDGYDYYPVDDVYVPYEITQNPTDYEFDSSDIEWDSSYSFKDSDYYENYLAPSTSSSSSSSSSSYSSGSDSSWDWSSGDSWDSGSSDWSSDW